MMECVWGDIEEENWKEREEERESWHRLTGWNSGRFLAILVGHFKSSPSHPSKATTRPRSSLKLTHTFTICVHTHTCSSGISWHTHTRAINWLIRADQNRQECVYTYIYNAQTLTCGRCCCLVGRLKLFFSVENILAWVVFEVTCCKKNCLCSNTKAKK